MIRNFARWRKTRKRRKLAEKLAGWVVSGPGRRLHPLAAAAADYALRQFGGRGPGKFLRTILASRMGSVPAPNELSVKLKSSRRPGRSDLWVGVRIKW